jgi:hypothetical protein
MKISIEQYENLVALLKQALKFYANSSNYHGAMGTIAPIDSDEQGSQARFALKKIEELEEINKKLELDIINSVDNTIDSEDNNLEDIINNFSR